MQSNNEEYWLSGDIDPWTNNGLFISGPLTVIEDQMPSRIGIKNIYPNPFNPSTTISFEVENRVKVKLEVYDVNGFKIKDLYSGYIEKGLHSVVWDAKEYSSGIYFIRLHADGYINTEKIMLIK